MNDIVIQVASVVALVAAFVLVFYLYILLPADMARERDRDPVIWVLISIIGSPLLAILLLVALGKAEA